MSRHTLPRLALASLLLVPLGSCVLVAGAGAAYVVNEEYLTSGVYETRLDVDVEDLWAAAREGMGILSTASAPEITQQPRQIRGEYRQRRITVDVQAVDLGESLLRVQAKQMIGFDEEVARDVSDYIIGRIDDVREED